MIQRLYKVIGLSLLLALTSACKEKLTPPRAKELVADYSRTHQGTSVTVRVPDFAQELAEETDVNYRTSPPGEGWTRQKQLVMDLAKAGLVDMTTREVKLLGVRGEYSRVGAKCPYDVKITNQDGATLTGSVSFLNSLYRPCDWGPFNEPLSGSVYESGMVLLDMPITMSKTRCAFTLSNGSLRPLGVSNDNTCQAEYRRTTPEQPSLTITKYRYSLTDAAKSLGLSPGGGDVKIGERSIDSVSELLLQGPTNATGRATFSVRFNALRPLLAPEWADRGSFGVIFGQSTEGRWVVTDLD